MSHNHMAFNGMPPFFPPNLVFHAPPLDEDSQHHNSLNSMLPNNSHDFRGMSSTMLGKRSISFAGFEPSDEQLNLEDDLSDDPGGEKKKRLNLEQVRILEKNFEMGNKLEPERKLQLARALGLQPRQIAIWFQNKRARWKTKQLEKDYDILKTQLEVVKADNDALKAQNKRLHTEILSLKGMEISEPINLNKETEGSCSNRSDNSSDVQFDMSRIPTTDSSPNHQQGQILFPAFRPPKLNYTKNDPHQCRKVEHGVQEENICNVFGNIDDQSTFWSWSEQQQNFQ